MNLTYRPFELAFSEAFGTARAVLKGRAGVIVRLDTEDGLVGLGEASPLPEFGGGTQQDVLSLLMNWWPVVRACPIEEALKRLDLKLPGAAALHCGIDTALCDIEAQRQSKRLAEWLAGGTVPESIPVNFTIASQGNTEAVSLARKAVASGYKYIKLKVGMAADVAGEVARVGSVREAIGDGVKLRLDANGPWTVEQAIATLEALAPFDLELVEQPVPAADLAGMAQVRRAVNVPIAADEAVTDLASARAVIEAGAADILVIKPMMVGGLRPGREIIKLAQVAGLKAFVTTTIDSGVGIAAALHLAATLPQPSMACGLATARLLESTLVKELPEISNGRMFLPQKPGLGVELA
jgi:o-succinylbenzoate synthase